MRAEKKLFCRSPSVFLLTKKAGSRKRETRKNILSSPILLRTQPSSSVAVTPNIFFLCSPSPSSALNADDDEANPLRSHRRTDMSCAEIPRRTRVKTRPEAVRLQPAMLFNRTTFARNAPESSVRVVLVSRSLLRENLGTLQNIRFPLF